MPEQALGGMPLGFGIVEEDKPCKISYVSDSFKCGNFWIVNLLLFVCKLNEPGTMTTFISDKNVSLIHHLDLLDFLEVVITLIVKLCYFVLLFFTEKQVSSWCG